MTGTATCALCGEKVADVFEHLRVMHPETWDDVEKWPDGGPVIAPFVEDCTSEAGA